MFLCAESKKTQKTKTNSFHQNNILYIKEVPHTFIFISICGKQESCSFKQSEKQFAVLPFQSKLLQQKLKQLKISLFVKNQSIKQKIRLRNSINQHLALHNVGFGMFLMKKADTSINFNVTLLCCHMQKFLYKSYLWHIPPERPRRNASYTLLDQVTQFRIMSA